MGSGTAATALPGYQRASRDSAVFTPCEDSASCPGGPFVEPPPPPACGAHQVASADGCGCDAGDLDMQVPGATSCAACASGADGSMPGNTVDDVRPLAGWYRVSADSATFIPCFFASRCPGA